VRLSFLVLALALYSASSTAQSTYLGFDRNTYPGDDNLKALHQTFSYTGYWLNNPPGERANTWSGHRAAVESAGFGFLVLFNGRPYAELKSAELKSAARATKLGSSDAQAATAAARREGFPAQTIIFLDQEEGGRLNANQSSYLLAWTETVAHSGYLPGVYASGQPVDDAPGKTITTIQDIRQQVAAQHLHEIAFWVYQDACPPAPGCTMQPPPLSSSGTPDVAAWQYAQSPRRKEITGACSNTYASDGNCYAPGLPKFTLDLSVASSPDPSHGR